jgi:hypothetical protein
MLVDALPSRVVRRHLDKDQHFAADQTPTDSASQTHESFNDPTA